MSGPLFQRTPLQQAFADLRRDLIDENGPRISTMRNYRFAIVQYDPVQEYKVRAETQPAFVGAERERLVGHPHRPAPAADGARARPG